MKKAFVLFLLLLPAITFAQTWEYQVIFLPGAAAGSKVEKHKSGGYLDVGKTKILNNLADEGWELVSVTGDSGADQAIYLRRGKDKR